MTPLLVYLSKVVICSGILYAYYYAVLRNSRFHQWNRYYLLLCTLLSLAVPLLRIPLPFTGTGAEDAIYVYTSQVVTLREQVFTPSNVSLIAKISWTTWMYGAVLLVLLLRIGAGYWKILSLIRSSQVKFLQPYWLVLSEKISTPFSFFRYIFWNNNFSAETPEGRQILRHEMVHLQEHHSSDKLLMEVLTALCWINPFFHLIKRELAMIHEFIADRKAVVNGDVAEYAQSILQMALQSQHRFHIANDFSHQPIKRRILMLTQTHRLRFSYLRRLCILPLAVLIFCSLAFVAREEHIGFNGNTMENKLQEGPGNGSERNQITGNQPDTTAPRPTEVVVVGYQAQKTQPARAAATRQEPPQLPRKDTIDPHNTIFTFVEQPPSFPGGQNALALYLSKNIKYPQQAISEKKSGTVFVTFIVKHDGSITGAKTVGARKGGGLEEEAVRVVREMPKWIPGKQNGHHVSVQFNLPIRFTLTDHKNPVSKGPKVGFNGIYRYADEMPAFPGGDGALARYISTSIRYPKIATEANKQGNVLLSFIVEDDGSLRDITVISQAIGGGLEEEAMRIAKGMPKWKPGRDGGRAVPILVNLPIRFVMQ